ncbi:hypothetical protein, partial [Vibrio alginolyticus]|uniref:hypothetical protein n=1 Tax=Vibrio alginolyticus TaxID=663 RepID=UPI001A8C6339
AAADSEREAQSDAGGAPAIVPVAPLPSRDPQPSASAYSPAAQPASDEAQPCALPGQQADFYRDSAA